MRLDATKKNEIFNGPQRRMVGSSAHPLQRIEDGSCFYDKHEKYAARCDRSGKHRLPGAAHADPGKNTWQTLRRLKGCVWDVVPFSRVPG